MTEPRRCTRCILSSRIPGISFDDGGVCGFCRDERFFATQQPDIDRARDLFASLLDQHRGAGEYDAVFCFSGGKDSTYTLLRAVSEYRLRVLAFTLDNGYIHRRSFDNIRAVVDHLGVDHIVIKPSRQAMREIIKASVLHPIYPPRSLIRISAGCNSCISMVNMAALRLALERNAPFIMAGFTLGQIPARTIVYQAHYQFLEESRSRTTAALHRHGCDAATGYLTLPPRLIDAGHHYPWNVNLLCFEQITEQQIIDAIRPIGWHHPEGLDGCTSNCMLNAFNNYAHQRIFGFSPYELELSQLIRGGLLNRSDALSKIAETAMPLCTGVMADLGIMEGDFETAGAEYAAAYPTRHPTTPDPDSPKENLA